MDVADDSSTTSRQSTLSEAVPVGSLTACDGNILNVALDDISAKKSDLVVGKYEIPAPADETTVAVKIIDMLGEEVLATATVQVSPLSLPDTRTWTDAGSRSCAGAPALIMALFTSVRK